MAGMVRGSVVALVAATAVLLGPPAGAQTPQLDLLEGVVVDPDVLIEHGEVSVTVPGFPGSTGCRSGSILAGSSIADSRVLLNGDFDEARTFTSSRFNDGGFATGTYSIFVHCVNEAGETKDYRTTETLEIRDTATTTTTTTTPLPVEPAPNTAAAPSTQGTVDPKTAKAGETTITIRGNGFKANTPLQISLNTTPPTALGSTAANADGTYATTLKMPATAPAGTHQLLVTGLGPDGASRSTTAEIVVVAATSTTTSGTTGRTRTAAATGSSSSGTAASPTATLPATGSDSSPYFVMAGLSAMTLGALFVGLSHPAVPSGGQHRRRRRGRHF